jgi:Membrane protein involved in the export of O-antigen and teichoic acid
LTITIRKKIDKLRRLKSLIKQAPKSEFFRNVATLFSGTALAQLIPLIITPILTRIYMPSNYGVLAVFVAFTSLCAVVATLRYDTAILLPANDDNAMALTILCGFFVLCIAGLISLLILMLHNPIINILKNPAIATWVYLIPLSVVFIGWSSAINYWLNRKKQYRKLAINRVSVALIAAMASLVFGFLGFSYAGLILAVIIGQFVALSMLLVWAWDDLRGGLRRMKRAELAQVAIAYRKFPLFALPSDAVNALSQQIPILMLSRFFGANVVGNFSFSQKILGMPLNLMSQSVSDVFRQRASADYSKLGNCKDIFNKTSKMLSALSIVPLVIIFLFAPIIFRIVFGEAWEQAGQYTRYLAPLYIFRFIISPLSYVFYIANRQDADLIGQLFLLFVSIGSMFFGFFIKSPDIAIMSFSCGYVLVYCFYFWGARNLSCGKSFVIFNHTSVFF